MEQLHPTNHGPRSPLERAKKQEKIATYSIALIVGLVVVLIVRAVTFAGTPGKSNCHGQSVSALVRQYGGLNAAAAALGYPSVRALQEAIMAFCGAHFALRKA